MQEFACLIWVVGFFSLTASTRLLALPLFCRKRERLSAGGCRWDGEWLRLGGTSWPCVYHKLLFMAAGRLPTLSDLCQSTCRTKRTPRVRRHSPSTASLRAAFIAPVSGACSWASRRGGWVRWGACSTSKATVRATGGAVCWDRGRPPPSPGGVTGNTSGGRTCAFAFRPEPGGSTCCCTRCSGRAVQTGDGGGGVSSSLPLLRRHSKWKEGLLEAETTKERSGVTKLQRRDSSFGNRQINVWTLGTCGHSQSL